MKPGAIDWKVMRGSLAGFLLALLASGALFAGGHWFWGGQEARRAGNARVLGEIRNRYRTLDDEERLIRALLPRYRELAAQGVIGPERRLDWIEALRAAARQLQLPELRYSIGARQRIGGDSAPGTGSVQVFRTLMELELGLLHEADLPRTLAFLERHARGLYSVSGCRIERAEPRFLHLGTAVNLRAACVLAWFTVRASPGDA